LPGRTPAEARKAFLDPLSSALSCIARGKITTVAGGALAPGALNTWTLNAGNGAQVAEGLMLKASMRYEVIRDDRDDMGPWRVTTRGYLYSVEDGGGRELLSWHWHPDTSGIHVAPHTHFPSNVISMDGAFLAREPLPSGRITFESVIRYVMRAFEVPPLCADWDARLSLAEGPHVLYRSWHNDPAEKAQRTEA
jgi:hypothetical protein